MIEKNYNAYVLIVLLSTLTLFTIGYYFNNVHAVVIGALELFILLEIVRSIIEYLLNGANRVKIRYLVDGVIAWFFKEIYLLSTYIQDVIAHSDDTISHSGLIKISALAIVMLFYTVLTYVFFDLRKKVIVESPDNLERKSGRRKTDPQNYPKEQSD